MARINPVSMADLPPHIREVFETRESLGVGKTHNAILSFARVPEIVLPLYALADRLILDREGQSRIDERIRHLVLLRVPRLNNCRYCTGHQTNKRRAQGYSEDEIVALLDDPLEGELFTDREKAALRFAEEVAKNVEPSIQTYAELAQHFTPEQIVELSAIVGFWCMWNRMVEVAKPDLDDDVYAGLVERNLTAHLLPASETARRPRAAAEADDRTG